MTISISDGVNVLDDYIIDIDEYPVYKRNRDFSPVINSFSFVLTSHDLPAIPENGDSMTVSINGTERGSYFVTNVKKDFNNLTYRITLTQKLTDLTYKALGSENLLSLIADTTGLTFPDRYYYRESGTGSALGHVMVLWAIKKIFEKVNLTLDYDSVFNLICKTYSGLEIRNSSYVMDFGMFWNINQQKVFLYTTIRDTNELRAQRITFWDFISVCCSFFGWKIIENGEDAYILQPMSYGESTTFEQDDTLDYQEDTFASRNSSAKAVFSYSTTRTDYFSGTGATLGVNAQGEASDHVQESIKWYNSLRFGIRSPLDDTAILGYFSVVDTTVTDITNAYNSLTQPYKQTTALIPWDANIYNCLEQSINAKDLTAKVITEAYI